MEVTPDAKNRAVMFNCGSTTIKILNVTAITTQLNAAALYYKVIHRNVHRAKMTF